MDFMLISNHISWDVRFKNLCWLHFSSAGRTGRSPRCCTSPTGFMNQGKANE
jgi:hypothetical protein